MDKVQFSVILIMILLFYILKSLTYAFSLKYKESNSQKILFPITLLGRGLIIAINSFYVLFLRFPKNTSRLFYILNWILLHILITGSFFITLFMKFSPDTVSGLILLLVPIVLIQLPKAIFNHHVNKRSWDLNSEKCDFNEIEINKKLRMLSIEGTNLERYLYSCLFAMYLLIILTLWISSYPSLESSVKNTENNSISFLQFFIIIFAVNLLAFAIFRLTLFSLLFENKKKRIKIKYKKKKRRIKIKSKKK